MPCGGPRGRGKSRNIQSKIVLALYSSECLLLLLLLYIIKDVREGLFRETLMVKGF